MQPNDGLIEEGSFRHAELDSLKHLPFHYKNGLLGKFLASDSVNHELDP